MAQDTRTLLVRGSLPNPKRKLLPGMFANVTVLVGDPRDGRHRAAHGRHLQPLRRQPLRGEGGGPAKAAGERRPAAARPDGERKLVAERRFVKTGQARDDRVAIVSGIEAGEEVVTTGQLKLNPGAAIRIDNAQPLVRPEERPKQ